jgi:hypothetical protein
MYGHYTNVDADVVALLSRPGVGQRSLRPLGVNQEPYQQGAIVFERYLWESGYPVIS